MARMATPPMERFVRTLLTERAAPAATVIRLTADIDAKRLTFDAARRAIDELKLLPFAGARPAKREVTVPVPGVFRHDGQIYVARFGRPRENGKRYPYAMRLVELGDGQGNRLDGAGDEVRYELEYEKDVIYNLAPEEQLPFDDAEVQAIMLQTSRCLVCWRALRVAKSIKQGMGPVCAKAFR